MNNDFFNKVIKKWLIGYFFLAPIYLLGTFYPYNTFLFRPGDRFGDTYKHICFFCSNLNPYHGFLPHDRIYNSVVYLSGIFCNLNHYIPAFTFFISYSLIGILFFLTFNKTWNFVSLKKLGNLYSLNTKIRKSFFICIFFVFLIWTSYPVLITIDRMNYDMYGFLFLYLYLLVRNDFRFIFFGLFLALKINYLFFILLPLLTRDSIFKVIGSIMLAISINFLSAFFFHAELIDTFSSFLRNIQLYNDYYSKIKYGIFTSSIWNIISLPYGYCLQFKGDCLDVLDFISKFYLVIFSLFGLIPLSYLFIKRRVIASEYKLLFLVVFFLLFSKTSPAYREIFILAPLVLIAAKNFLKPIDKTLLILIIVFIFPKNISMHLFLPLLPPELHIAYIIDPIILCIIYSLLILKRNELYEKN